MSVLVFSVLAGCWTSSSNECQFIITGHSAFSRKMVKTTFRSLLKTDSAVTKNFIVQFHVHFYAICFGSIKSKTKCK